MHAQAALRVLMLPLAIVLHCVACTPVAAGADAASKAGMGERAKLPAIHAILVLENVNHGVNVSRENYRTQVDACHRAGWPVRELGANEIAQLGTGRVEVMIDRRHQRVVDVRWELGFENGGATARDMCLFRIDETVDDYSPDPDFYDSVEPVNEESRQQIRASGLGKWTLAADDSVGGQPCTRWRDPTGDVCMWSAGRQWGFDDGPISTGLCDALSASDFLRYIPLDATPARGIGCIVHLESFSLGKGLLPGNLPATNEKGIR